MLYHPESSLNDNFSEFVNYLDSHDGFKLHSKKVIEDGQIVMWKVGNNKYSRKDFEKIMTHFYNEV